MSRRFTLKATREALELILVLDLLFTNVYQLVLKQLILREVDKKSGVCKEEKGVWGSQEGDRGMEFSSPGNLPNPGIELVSPARAAGFFISEPPGKPFFSSCVLCCT